ncbi:hypothetical protein Moror_3000 [Moniliophthora roreri MCA 2997]|uniref:Uncharacterized protein n=2 Tax=Moniliophthora roreri TaxID=221103 RepID=V2WPI0_MONRO|nr:hypothetical protein Moror_3000 [Moniliophthora roreri MCA 2997]
MNNNNTIMNTGFTERATEDSKATATSKAEDLMYLADFFALTGTSSWLQSPTDGDEEKGHDSKDKLVHPPVDRASRNEDSCFSTPPSPEEEDDLNPFLSEPIEDDSLPTPSNPLDEAKATQPVTAPTPSSISNARRAIGSDNDEEDTHPLQRLPSKLKECPFSHLPTNPVWSDDEEEEEEADHPFRLLLSQPEEYPFPYFPNNHAASVRPIWSEEEEEDDLNPFLSEPIEDDSVPTPLDEAKTTQSITAHTPPSLSDARRVPGSDNGEEDTLPRRSETKNCQLSRLPTNPAVGVRPIRRDDKEKEDNLNPLLSKPIENEFFPLPPNPFAKKPKQVADEEEDEYIPPGPKPIEPSSSAESLALPPAPLSNYIAQPNNQTIYLPRDTPVFVNPFPSASNLAPVFFGSLPSWEQDDYILQSMHLPESQSRTAIVKAAENVSPTDVVPPVEAGKGKAPAHIRRTVTVDSVLFG